MQFTKFTTVFQFSDMMGNNLIGWNYTIVL